MSKKLELRSIIHSFKYENDDVKETSNKISKKKAIKTKKIERNKHLPDLKPSLTDDLTIVFVGYNPGIESSVKQHHYAHFTNLFWKLFNESRLLLKVLNSLNMNVEETLQLDQFLQELIHRRGKEFISVAKPEHDFDLVKYKIGFTDLVLRCTKTAQELTMREKLENVPRLISEFNSSKTKIIAFIGKGIWEVLVKYMCGELGVKLVKLNKDNFHWGRQIIRGDNAYDDILSNFKQRIPKDTEIFVFPNTSGLVASMTYLEKLQLWVDLCMHV